MLDKWKFVKQQNSQVKLMLLLVTKLFRATHTNLQFKKYCLVQGWAGQKGKFLCALKTYLKKSFFDKKNQAIDYPLKIILNFGHV